jgi:hypothetical protein
MKALALLVWFGLLQDPAKPVQGRDEILKQDVENAVKRLGSKKGTESYVAQEELVALGRKAVPAVVAELLKKDAEAMIKRACCEILGAVRAPDKDAVKALSDKLKDTDEFGTSIAAAAARALGSIGDESVSAALVETLKSRRVDTDKVLKFECIRALGQLRAPEASEPIRKALEDKKPASVSDDDSDSRLVATAAADALGLLRAQDALDDLGKALADVTNDPASGQSLGVHAARALQRILEHELRGKAEKDEPRAGTLAGEADEVKKTHDAWKTWYEGRKAKKDIADTREKITKLAAAVEAYRKEQGELPAVLDQLKIKPDKAKTFPKDGYYQGDLNDAWGRKIYYSGKGTGADFDLVSYGKDGATWGGGDAADLWNHEAWKPLKKEETKKALEEAKKVIAQFHADNARYPDTLKDLLFKPSYAVNKWPEKGYVQALPKDGYDEPLKFKAPGSGGEAYDLWSLGADRAEGGADENEDVWNHDKRPPAPKKDEKKN